MHTSCQPSSSMIKVFPLRQVQSHILGTPPRPKKTLGTPWDGSKERDIYAMLRDKYFVGFFAGGLAVCGGCAAALLSCARLGGQRYTRAGNPCMHCTYPIYVLHLPTVTSTPVPSHCEINSPPVVTVRWYHVETTCTTCSSEFPHPKGSTTTAIILSLFLEFKRDVPLRQTFG